MIRDFFSTFGLGRFEDNIDRIEKEEDAPLFTLKNVAEYFPVVGAFAGISALTALKVNKPPHEKRPFGYPKDKNPKKDRSLTLVARIGLIAHSVLGILGVGLILFPVDIVISIVRQVQLSKAKDSTLIRR
jgi:hypothetical protein